MFSDSKPTGPIASKGLELLTMPTPNGVKVSILLEELKDAYGLQYEVQNIPISTNVQKEPWFTKYGPNGRIPVLVDHDKDFSVMEGLAILEYLTRFYDPDHKFSFTDPLEQIDALQWMAWQHGGVGPMQGQANHFLRYAKERIPYGIQRYVGETERLYGVANTRLASRDYLVGAGRGKYSIVDINLWGWVNFSAWSGVDLAQFPDLQRWWKSLSDRPAVQRGSGVPGGPMAAALEKYASRLKEEEGFQAKEDEKKEEVQKAKEQYGYKFAPV